MTSNTSFKGSKTHGLKCLASVTASSSLCHNWTHCKSVFLAIPVVSGPHDFSESDEEYTDAQIEERRQKQRRDIGKHKLMYKQQYHYDILAHNAVHFGGAIG